MAGLGTGTLLVGVRGVAEVLSPGQGGGSGAAGVLIVGTTTVTNAVTNTLLYDLNGTLAAAAIGTNLQLTAGGTLNATSGALSGTLVVGSTPISGGGANRLLYDNGGTLEEAIIGAGASLSGGTLITTSATPLAVGTTPVTGGASNDFLYESGGTLAAAVIGTGLSLSGGTLISSNPTPYTLTVGTSPVSGGTSGDFLYENSGTLSAAVIGIGLSFAGGTLTTNSSTPIAVGTTPITGGASNDFLYENSGVIGAAVIGSGLGFSGGTLTSNNPTPYTLTVGVSTVASGTSGAVLYDNAGTLGDLPLGTGLEISSGTLISLLSVSNTQINGGTNADFLYDSSGVLAVGAFGSGLSFAGGTLTANNPTPYTLTVGTSLISGGANGDFLYDNNGTLGAAVIGSTLLFSGGTLSLNLSNANTWAAAQTFPSGDIVMKGSSTGVTVFDSANASATNYTITFPAASDTVVYMAAAQALTNKTLTSNSNVLGGVTMTLGSDATGDIYYRNSSGDLTRLGIGSSSQFLGVSGGIPAWGTPAGGGGGFAGTITVGTTIVSNGGNGDFLYDNNGTLGALTNFVYNGSEFQISAPLQLEASIGALFTTYNDGTLTSGNYTLSPTLGNYHAFTDNGAVTLVAPSVDCAIDTFVSIGSSASALVFSGFTAGANTGSSLSIGSGNRYIVSIRRIYGVAAYSVYALQ